MTLEITFSPAVVPNKGVLALIVQDGKLGPQGLAIDKTCSGLLSKLMKTTNFKNKEGHTLTIPGANPFDAVVLINAESADKLDPEVLKKSGSYAWAALSKLNCKSAAVVVDFSLEEMGLTVAQVGYGAVLKSYRFDKYHTKLKAEDLPILQTLAFHCGKETAEAKKEYQSLDALIKGIFFARDLVSEPANVLYPESFADLCVKLKSSGLKVKVLDEPAMRKLGMGSLLGVAQGSARPPRLVSFEWNGNPKAKGDDKKPIALLGKGVTFDTGGISIKPALGMWDMKFDMGGAAAVVGTMYSLALRKAKVNVVGLIGLVENMPDGNAQRPGDIVTSMSGQTIEVLNTDAEGRLVLADVLTYAQRTFKPRMMVDLATLTGAVIIALGHEYAGVLTNNVDLAEQLIEAGDYCNEKLWQLPMHKAYDKDLDSPIADMKNIGQERVAGTITGAAFIHRFVENETPWAHLDIAGTAWNDSDAPLCPKGATGFGVRLLNQFLADFYED